MFTAEVDVRPEISLPDLGGDRGDVDAVTVADADIDDAAGRPARALRDPQERGARGAGGDFVQIDLAATVDGEEVPGGTAPTCPTRSAATSSCPASTRP